MSDKFDRLAKGVAQSVTRRQALRRLGLGVIGMAVACLGLANSKAFQSCLPFGAHCQKGPGNKSDNCSQCCDKSYGCFTDPTGAEICECC